MNHNGENHHCLRPLSDAPGYTPPPRLATDGTGSTHHPGSASNGFTQGPTADAVSRALIRVLRERTGRGPTKVRTDIASDLAIVTVEDSLTPAERTLISDGDRALVAQFRTALHDGMRAEAVAVVEEITGRQVAAYLSAQEPDHDRAVIAFHFSP